MIAMFRSLLGAKLTATIGKDNKIQTMSFTPAPKTDIVLDDNHWSCATCYYLGIGRTCLKYDSPCPVSDHGDEICWRKGSW